jgi:hypothetical protein
MAGRCGRSAVTPCRFYLRPKIACLKKFSEKFHFSLHLYQTVSDCIEPHRTVSYFINNVD